MANDSIEFNKKAARKLAEEKDFDKDRVKVCVACGRTVVQTQKGVHSGLQDNVYCTCEEKGPPMVSITDS